MTLVKKLIVKSNLFIDANKEINSKNPKFKIGDIVRISKWKTLFTKVTLQIGNSNQEKGDKFYVKWKGYNNSFNSWID